MKTFLQAQKALEAAKGNLARAEMGKNAKEIAAAAKLVGDAHEDVINAAAKDPALRAQHRSAIEAKVIHHERYEKRTVQQPDSAPASSAPASSEEEEAMPETSPSKEEPPSSSVPASEEEEGRKAKGAKKAEKASPPKMRKKSEERRGESEEEEEEKALAACYEAADKAYRKEARARGLDAYSIRGPVALLGAVTKALKTTGVHESFGALEGMPRQRAAHAAVEDRVGKLEADGRKARVKAAIDKARSEGRAISKELGKELQALGEEKGTAWLRGHMATLPKLRTVDKALEAVEGEDGRGAISTAYTKDQAKIIEMATLGMSAEDRAAFMKDLGVEQGKKRAKAAVV